MFVLCVLYSKDKRQNPEKYKEVRIEYSNTTTKKSRWGRDFPQPSRRVNSASYTMVPGLFPVGKVAGRGVNHPHLTPRLKNE